MFKMWKEYYKKNFLNSMVTFSGRISRKEFICREIFLFLTALVPVVIIFGFLGFSGKNIAVGMIGASMLLWLAVIILFGSTYLSLVVRRLHDCGKSGKIVAWLIIIQACVTVVFGIGALRGTDFNMSLIFYLLMAVSAVISVSWQVLVLYVHCAVGQPHDNKYGEQKNMLTNDWWDNNVRGMLPQFMQYIKSMNWKADYFTFKGRLSCAEYYKRVYGVVLFLGILSIIESIVSYLLIVAAGINNSIVSLFIVIRYVGLGIALIAGLVLFPTDVRRNHDFGRSWLMSLLVLIPIVNGFYCIRQFCMDGDLAGNKYGEARIWYDEDGRLHNSDY